MAEIKVDSSKSVDYQYGQMQYHSQRLLDMYVELLAEAIAMFNIVHPNRHAMLHFMEEIEVLESATGKSFDEIMEEYQ